VTGVRTLTLAGGASIPVLGLGTWPMSDDEAETSVARAIALGYRLFDTAYQYGNEIGVGRGVRVGGLPRKQVFVTTKLNGEWHGVDGAREALHASLDRLGFDYVDLYLIHWPMPRQDRYVQAWESLLKLREEGLARAVGVSNFKPAHIDRLLEATGIAPEVNQVELNPTVTRAALRAYDAGRGIATQSWSPLGQGGALLAHPEVARLAARHDKTPAQIVLRWHMELGLAAVPKSSSPERMAANIAIFDFRLTGDEVAALSSLDRGESAAVDSDVVGH